MRMCNSAYDQRFTTAHQNAVAAFREQGCTVTGLVTGFVVVACTVSGYRVQFTRTYWDRMLTWDLEEMVEIVLEHLQE